MVADKVKEIGTLRAMGAGERSIAAIFVLQGLIIGVVGTAGGLVLGTVIAWFCHRYELLKLDPDVYYLTHIPFSTRVSDLVIVCLVSLAISLLATIYPAFRAARLDPVEAIRHE